MRIYIAFLIFFVFLISSNLFAQSEIRGRVRNNGGNESIVGGTIYLLPQIVDKKNSGKKMTTISQEDGNFVLENVPEGTYDLECYAPGFITQRIVGFQIKKDQIKLAYFRMKVGSAAKQGVDIIYTYASLQAKQKAEITTATQTEESLSDAPATVYLITEKEIDERGYYSIIDVLEDIPEIEIHDKSDPEVYNKITVRGISGNERLLILMDGVRLNSGASTAHAINQNFPVQFIDHIEVLIGPVSSVYGADAFNGVVNIITKKGNQIQGGSIKSSYGMYHTTENTAIVGFGDKDINLSVSGSYFRSEEPYMPKFYADDYSWYNNQYLTEGNLRVSPFNTDTTQIAILPYDMHREAFAINARLCIKRFEIGLSHRQEMHSSTTGGMPEFYPPIDGSRFGSSLSNVYVKHSLKSKNNKWLLESLAHWNYFEIKTASKFLTSTSSYKDAYKFGFDNNAQINEQISYQINKKHRISFQLSGKYTYALPKTGNLPFRWNRGQDAAGITQYYIGTDLFDADSVNLRIYQSLFFMSRFNIGSSFQYQGNFGDKLSFTFTNRTDYNSDYGLTVNPRLGIVYKPGDSWRFKLFYGKSFLAPSPQKEFDHFGALMPIQDNTENITGFRGAFWRLPNEDILPEQLRSIEIASSYAKGDFTINGDLYVSYASNLIDYEVLTNQLFRGINIAVAEKPINMGNAFYFGGAVSFNYRIPFGKENDMELNIFGSSSYSAGSVRDSGVYVIERPALSARFNVKLGTSFRYKALSASIRAYYRSSVIAEDINAQSIENIPSYFLLNTSIKYLVLSKKVNLSIFANVRNATDSRYYHGAADGSRNFGAMPQDPIRISGGIELTFGKK